MQKTVLVTGASGSIGKFMVQSLLDDGCKVVAIDRAMDQASSKISSYQMDLTNSAEVKKQLPEIMKEHAVDSVVQLAGLIHSAPLINILNKDNPYHSFEKWDEVIQSNLYSTFNVGSVTAQFFVKSRTRGLIVNVSSISAAGNIGQSAYSAAKAGVEALTVTWAKELSAWGIRSVCIQPGFFDVPSTHAALDENKVEALKKSIPLKRLGSLDEFAHCLKFVLMNQFYNGEVIRLNGGQRI